MQRFNFQFTGQRFFGIEDGRLAGQVRDVGLPGDHHGLLGLHGGGRRTRDLGAAAARSTAARPSPGQVAAVSHGCPTALFRDVNILNTIDEAGH